MEVRILPSRDCSILLRISVSNCSICSCNMRSSRMSWLCSKTRPRWRIISLVPILWLATCWSCSNWPSVGRLFARKAIKAEKGAVERRVGSGKVLTERQGCWQIRIFEHLGQLGKEFIADGRELIFSSRSLLHQFVAMTHPSLQLEGRFRRRKQASDQMRLVSKLNATLELIEQMIREAECIALVGFEYAWRALLDGHDVNR